MERNGQNQGRAARLAPNDVRQRIGAWWALIPAGGDGVRLKIRVAVIGPAWG
jgi:hypothetical protein